MRLGRILHREGTLAIVYSFLRDRCGFLQISFGMERERENIVTW